MPTILVVEDELDVATMIGTVLEDEGYEVILARQGREALDILAARRPDLVVSDLMMPVMDGYALCAAMQVNPEWRSIPLVLVSAGAPPPDSGYTRFLPKPFAIDALLHLAADLTSAP